MYRVGAMDRERSCSTSSQELPCEKLDTCHTPAYKMELPAAPTASPGLPSGLALHPHPGHPW